MHGLMVPAAAILLGVAATVAAQEPTASPVRLFEAGQYEAAAAQVQGRLEAGETPPEDVYWAAQSLVRMDRDAEAAGVFRRLGGEDGDPWRAVGNSAAALAEGQKDVALQQALRAVELAPDLFFSQYQHALVRMDAQQWQPASEAFERATEIDGNAAYAHYYAGMAYNRLKRIDRMVPHLQRFLELAPQAPEREQVQQVLRMMKSMR